MSEDNTEIINRRALPLRLRDSILDQVRSGELRPGAQLPPEAALCERFGVSRSTVREAIKLLERDGVIDVQHGRGSFVSGIAQLGTERPITLFESVTDMMHRLGYTVENRVLSVGEQMASEDEARELDLERHAPIVRLERLRLHDGQPFVFSVNVVARSVFDEPLEEVRWGASMIDLLDERGCRVVASSAHLRATSPPEELVATGVELPIDPWLLITETCVTATGVPVLLAQDYHRGDAFAFHAVRRRFPD
jgi:GntR family transcriptional regulator